MLHWTTVVTSKLLCGATYQPSLLHPALWNKDVIDFKKLDSIYLNNGETDSNIRSKACIIETMKRITFNLGDTYSEKDEIYSF